MSNLDPFRNKSVADKIKDLIKLDDKLVKVQRDTILDLAISNRTGGLKGPELAFVENLYSHYILKQGNKTYKTIH